MAPAAGYWGPPTSTLDWCEENYISTLYIAEFWNTISSGFMVLAPLLMVGVGVREGHDRRFLLSFLAVAVVGIGSWLFHMTLLYSMQLMDELPMIWGGCFATYSFYMMRKKEEEENKAVRAGMVAYGVLVTLVYIVTNMPVFHEVAFGVLIIATLVLSIQAMKSMSCHVTLVGASVFCHLFGFLLWNIDNWNCATLKSMRATLGGRSGPLLQLHAYWHVFAGMGCYLSLLFTVHTRYLYLDRRPNVKFLCGVMPYVTIREDYKNKL